MMSESILQVRQLYKTFDTQHGRLNILQNISFHVKLGEFVCLVGVSGCGKSTLLRILAGLIPYDSGEIYLHGQPVTEPNQNIGMVFQKPNLMAWRTVLDNVLLPLQVQNMPYKMAQAQVQEALNLVGLSDFGEHYPHQLSGGQQQRVAIARTFVHKPEILFLDEPFSALDALTRERLNQELLRIWQTYKKTVVMVTHNVREAVFLADRVLVLSQIPSHIVDTIPITLSRPRSGSLFYDKHFNDLAYYVRQSIKLG